MVEEAVHRVLVDRLQVVHLEEGVEQHLHVALHVVALLVHEARLLWCQLGEEPGNVAEVFLQGRRVGVFVHEDPIAEPFTAHGRQRMAVEV